MLNFEPYRLAPAQRLLLQCDRPLPISSRALDLLITLVEHAGALLTKDQLRRAPGRTPTCRSQSQGAHQRNPQTAGRWPGRPPLYRERSRARLSLRRAGQRERRGGAACRSTGRRRTRRGQPEHADQFGLIVGRDEVIDRIAQLLSKRRLVTIAGPGGVGKTTVALALADRLRRLQGLSACFVDLAPLMDQGLVHSALASSLGLVSGAEDLDLLLAFLRDKGDSEIGVSLTLAAVPLWAHLSLIGMSLTGRRGSAAVVLLLRLDSRPARFPEAARSAPS